MSLTPEELEQIRKIRNCLPFATIEAGIEETGKAMDQLLAHVAALQAELDKRDKARILAGTPLTDVESAVWNALTDAEVVLVYGEDADWMERVGRTREHFQDVKVKILEGARERQTAKIKREDKR